MTDQPSVSVIMPTAAFDGTFERCARRVMDVLDELHGTVAEFIVALDGERRAVPDWLRHPRVKVVCTGTRSGPAHARNIAASASRGDILLFIDADVEMDRLAIDKVSARFASDPQIVGVFGAYDDEPEATGTVSMFRNMLHNHTHASHAGPASTFWAGCGAIDSRILLASGGFDPRYRHPSVEDVELGLRISAAGGRILLDPTLRCKHLKSWSLASMVHADVFRRALPWTRMMFATQRLPATLATDCASRTSGVLATLALLLIIAALLMPGPSALVTGALAAVIAVLIINRRFYFLCARKRGFGFAVAAVGLHLLFLVYASATFGCVVVHHVLGNPLGKACGVSEHLLPLPRDHECGLELA